MKEYRFVKDCYEIVLTAQGTGQSFFKGLAVNRWSGDPLAEGQGFLVYLRDPVSGAGWSATPRPRLLDGQEFEGSVAETGIAWHTRHDGIASRLQAGCAAHGRGELRQLELVNESERPRTIELTSYLEVVLHHRDADAGHPAFQKLFVQTEWEESAGALLAHRRARGNDESWPWLVHRLLGGEASAFETDRLRFLGRGRDAGRPRTLDRGAELSNTAGNVLDACFSLRAVLVLQPGEERRVGFFVGGAATREEALELGAEMLSPLADPRPLEIPALIPAWCVTGEAQPRAAAAREVEPLRQFNGWGGFSEDGREYVIRLPWKAGEPGWTPLPWVNCIANPQAGLLVSESGAACTWARNSQANRLTPWNNDPVSDPHGEALYVRDEENGQFWSPLPGPAPAPADHEVRHGWGYSVFHSSAHDLEHEVTFFAAAEDPVRLVRWRVANPGNRARRLSLISFCRLVLGNQVPGPGALVTGAEPGLAVLTAAYPDWSEFRGRRVFASAAVDGTPPERWHFTCDRREFVGEDGGGMRRPAALRRGGALSGRSGPGLDACFAQQVEVAIPAGGEVEAVFLLGECDEQGEQSLAALLRRHRAPGAAARELAGVRDSWRAALEGIQVATPVPELDVMLNGWLGYQAIACRIVGRTAFYQSSGAYGYRDQLQDAHGMALLRPALVREQILRHAARQFAEGDVMHWWHPEPIERGLRTRFSDDLLWLAYVTTAYVNQTGDESIWREEAPFLTGDGLAEGQDECYLPARLSGETGSVYEHCCRAVDRSLATGEHGLPLMGTGDWNDGMNRIGRLGRGESVWMAFFLCDVLRAFAPWCEKLGDPRRAERYLEHVSKLAAAVEEQAWDGAWYRRAYYDDGTPLGTAAASECRIDGLVQSWAVISGVARPERAAQAMQSAWEHLADPEHGMVRLLAPPFVDAPEDPGYIKGYVAGVRENGGQYTHAACWFAKALALLGRRADAGRMLAWLSPAWHAADQAAAERYKVEPYVVAADIYHGCPHTGRGGWTWYTGSAAWCYRVALETVLGFSISGGRELVLQPRVPEGWKSYRLRYRHGGGRTVYEIEVSIQGSGAGPCAATLDGSALALEGGCVRLELVDDGAAHSVVVVLG